MLRDALPTDWPEILALNEAWVHFLSPMDEARLEKLAAAACTFRIIEKDGRVAAFLMAFRKGAAYDGAVFAMFDARENDFVYVDRIVVDPRYRGQGLADRLYDDVENFARTDDVERVLCEVNIEPPNEGSLRFHERRGYREIGQFETGGKIVSLRGRLVRDQKPAKDGQHPQSKAS